MLFTTTTRTIPGFGVPLVSNCKYPVLGEYVGPPVGVKNLVSEAFHRELPVIGENLGPVID